MPWACPPHQSTFVSTASLFHTHATTVLSTHALLLSLGIPLTCTCMWSAWNANAVVVAAAAVPGVHPVLLVLAPAHGNLESGLHSESMSKWGSSASAMEVPLLGILQMRSVCGDDDPEVDAKTYG